MTGFDRVAANGDVANKVGTYGLALAARAAGSRSWRRAPRRRSTPPCPAATRSRSRSAAPRRCAARAGALLTVPGTPVRNPAFDVTPARAGLGARDRARRRAAGRRGLGGCGRMRAARTLTLDSTVTVTLPDPACGPGEVICRIIASATCGSDVHGWYVARKLPAVLGHEPVGEVVEVGAGRHAASRPATSSRSTTTRPAAPAASAPRGHETLCPRFRATRLDPGGFAEYVRIQPELVDDLLPLDGLDPIAATCTEPLACALRAQDRVGLTPRDTLLVVGAGTSGLLHIGAARARGVERVLVAEPRADRRERALEWGAAAFAPGEPVDVAIVTSHHPQAIAAAAEALAPGGRLCAYAPPEPGAPIAVDGAEIFLRELTVTSSWSSGAADWRAALALLRSGAVSVDGADHAPLRARRDRRGARRPAGRERAEGGRAAVGRAVMGTGDVLEFVARRCPLRPRASSRSARARASSPPRWPAPATTSSRSTPRGRRTRACDPSRCSTSTSAQEASTPPWRSCRCTTWSRWSRRWRTSARSCARAGRSSPTSSTSRVFDAVARRVVVRAPRRARPGRAGAPRGDGGRAARPPAPGRADPRGPSPAFERAPSSAVPTCTAGSSDPRSCQQRRRRSQPAGCPPSASASPASAQVVARRVDPLVDVRAEAQVPRIRASRRSPRGRRPDRYDALARERVDLVALAAPPRTRRSSNS